MYTISSAYGINVAAGSVWQEQDVTDITGVSAYRDFSRLFLSLETDLLDDPVNIDLESLRLVIYEDTRPLTEIFSSWTDPTPLEQSVIPRYRSSKVIYTDVLRADYIAQKSIPGAHYTSTQDNILKSELQLTRENTDMRRLEKFALISCNGLLYRVEANNSTAFVPEAGKSLLRSNLNHIGIVSFETIGEIKTYPVSPDVIPHTAGTMISSGANIALPDVDLTNKSLILVIAGYMHFSHTGIFSAVGNSRALVKVQKLELVERYRESVSRMDWSTIVDSSNPSLIYADANTMFSDDGIRALFAHPQTFWVVVDTPNLTVKKTPVQALPIPGNFISPAEPTEVMVTGNGLIVDYWKIEDTREWGVYAAGLKTGKSVNSSVGRDLWSGRATARDLPFVVRPNTAVSTLSIIANQIPA